MIKNEWIGLALCAFSLVGFAVDYTWTGAGAESDGAYASHFENPGNYSNGDGYPATGDVIVIPADTDLAITNRVDLDWLKRLSRVKPEAETSRLIITVPSGETWTNSCPMSAVNVVAAGGSDFVKGEIVKKGDGVLQLLTGEKLVAANQASTIYDFWTGITICDGVLRMPQEQKSCNYYLGYVTVSNGATFHTSQRAPSLTANTCTTYVRGLFGDGDVTNGDTRTFTIMPSASQRTTEFYGRFLGSGYITVYNNGTVNLLGTNSVNAGYLHVQQGTAGVWSIGRKGASSSIGTYETIYFAANKSRLVYLGKGETTDKTFFVHQTLDYPAYMDGGPHGGLVLKGDIRPSDKKGAPRTFVFTGSNTTECVIDCILYGSYSSSSATYEHIYYAKEGTGTWRATHHTGRNMPSGWAVREGTLKYDSLDDEGYICSLGTATNLTVSGTTDKADYAFCLGSSDPSAAEAIFAYSGTNEYNVTTRLIALAGDATFRNDSEKAIRFAGANALSAGLKMFTLDGDGGMAQTNEFADISDGNGQLGVAKKGSATWVLGGDLTFSGPVDVQEGTLVVRRIAKTKYDWFRWTIKDLHVNSNGTVDYPNVNAFALLDSAGTWQNENLSFVTNDVATMAPGTCAYQTAWSVSNGWISANYDGSLEKMFTKSGNYGAFMFPMRGKTTYRPVEDNRSSWIRVVMRLKADAKEIASYDIMPVWGTATKKRAPKSYILEGSVDGLHWEQIATEEDMPVGSASWTWAYANVTGYPNPHTGGAPVDRGSSTRTWHVLEGGNTVSVAPGAKLVADGDITLSSIKLAAAGGGTIEGFSFAESGTIDVTGWNGSHEEIPLNFSNAANLSNVSGWNLKIGGAASSRRFAVSTTGVRLLERGLRLSFR